MFVSVTKTNNMTAKEFFESQLITDANSVIKKYAKYYNRFDMIRFAEAYHRNEVKKSNIPDVSQRSELLLDFLIHLNNKGLINNHDFDYEKEAKKYVKKIN